MSVRLTEEKAKEIYHQILDAIHYLHNQNIAHRDIKPENILLKSKDCDIIKITDFGLSRAIGDGSIAKTLCGTALYLAPEVMLGNRTEGYGLEVDMWSMGVVLYFMLSGTLPFDESKANIFESVRKAEYDFPSPTWDGISEVAKDLIKCLLVVDPTKRYTAAVALNHPWFTKSDFTKYLRDREEKLSIEEKKAGNRIIR